MVFPENNPSNHNFDILDSDKHSTDPACIKCHQQLDPMGKTFRGIASQLSPFATPGAFVMQTETGLESTEVEGLGELVTAITQSKTYERCQTQIFWNWFIGYDRPLSPDRHNELIQEFNRHSHRVNDFILYLLQECTSSLKRQISQALRLLFLFIMLLLLAKSLVVQSGG